MEAIRIQTSTGLLIGKLIDDNIPEMIQEFQSEKLEYNTKLLIAGKVFIWY